jgi:curved DNA-binding protein CbpA
MQSMAARGDPRGYYRELGVHRSASADEIRNAFRERAKLLHPDQGSEAGDDSGFKRLAEAYETLKDPRRRLQYDAEGLAAERDRERARRADEEGVLRRGERPHRLTPLEPVAAERRAPPAWLAAVAALGVLLAAAAGLLWQARGDVATRDAQLVELGRRYSAALRGEEELRARYRAQSVAGIAELRRGDAPAAGGARALYAAEIAFPPGSAELDGQVAAAIDAAVVGLSRALRQVPDSEAWLVVVDGHAGAAARDGGVAVAQWETALLRLGAVLDRLVAQGLPADRLATRFQAGFAPSGAAAETPVLELRLVCCFE